MCDYNVLALQNKYYYDTSCTLLKRKFPLQLPIHFFITLTIVADEWTKKLTNVLCQAVTEKKFSNIHLISFPIAWQKMFSGLRNSWLTSGVLGILCNVHIATKYQPVHICQYSCLVYIQILYTLNLSGMTSKPWITNMFVITEWWTLFCT